MNQPTYFYDPKLAQMIRDAERARKWYWRINWGPICGALIAVGVSTLAWYGIVEAVIYANRWFQ